MPQNTVLNTNVILEHSITRLASRISRPAFYARQESIVKGTAEQSQMVIVIQAFSVEVLQAMPDLEILEHYLQVQQPFVGHAISLMIVYAQHSIQQQVGHSLKSHPTLGFRPFCWSGTPAKYPRGPPFTSAQENQNLL